MHYNWTSDKIIINVKLGWHIQAVKKNFDADGRVGGVGEAPLKDCWTQSKSVDGLTNCMLRINKTGLEPVSRKPNIQYNKAKNIFCLAIFNFFIYPSVE